MAVTAGTSGTLSVLLGKGDGTCSASNTISVGAGASAVTVADFDNDGRLDLAVAVRLGNNVVVLLGDGTGRSLGNIKQGALQSLPVGDTGTRPL